jgi:hypothetical protein
MKMDILRVVALHSEITEYVQYHFVGSLNCMKTSIVFLTTLLILGCNSTPKNGIEISNGQFHQLIRTQSIASITYLAKEMKFGLELTDPVRE